MSITMTDDTDSSGTDDANGSVATIDIGVYDVKALKIIDSEYEQVADFPTDRSIKFKRIDMNRSTFTRLRQSGVLEKDEDAMGMEARWRLSDYGQALIDAYERGADKAITFTMLDEEQAETLDKHADVVRELPADTSETFKLRDHDMARGTLVVLQRRGFVETETERNGAANSYSVTDTLADILDK